VHSSGLAWPRRAVVGAFLLWSVFPFYWMAKSAFEPAELIYHPELYPRGFTLANIRMLFEETGFSGSMINSMVVAIMSCLLVCAASTVGGYALSRYAVPAKRHVARLILFAYMFPDILLGIPFFSIFRELGLVNSLPGLALAHMTHSFPFALWLMWQTFEALPRDFEQAAAIDGASRLQTLVHVVFPMVLPSIVAVLIFAFAASWNDYTLSLMLIRDNALFTLPLSVSLFVTQLQLNWAVVQAAALFLAVPGFFLVFLGQRSLLRGFGAGGLAN
jgi:multiple sugar transport system permease protein